MIMPKFSSLPEMVWLSKVKAWNLYLQPQCSFFSPRLSDWWKTPIQSSNKNLNLLPSKLHPSKTGRLHLDQLLKLHQKVHLTKVQLRTDIPGTLKLTASLHLKMDGWKMNWNFGKPYLQAQAVSFREGIRLLIKTHRCKGCFFVP